MKTKKVNLTKALYNKLDKLIDIIPNLDLENTNDGEVQIQYYKIKFKHINKLFKIKCTIVPSKRLIIISSTNIKSKERREEVYIDSNVCLTETNSIVIQGGIIVDAYNLELLVKRFILERVNEIYVNEKEYPLASINPMTSSDSKKPRRRTNDNRR